MTPDRLLKTAILPALQELSSMGIPSTHQAARFMLAIAMQESNIAYRRQLNSAGEQAGPAASFWQFEVGGGCKGVLTHSSASPRMIKICDAFNVKAEPLALWEAMRYQDIVAAAAARLLIFTLPVSLPETQEKGWEQYLKAWRPGKPHPERWSNCWATASQTVGVA